MGMLDFFKNLKHEIKKEAVRKAYNDFQQELSESCNQCVSFSCCPPAVVQKSITGVTWYTWIDGSGVSHTTDKATMDAAVKALG